MILKELYSYRITKINEHLQFTFVDATNKKDVAGALDLGTETFAPHVNNDRDYAREILSVFDPRISKIVKDGDKVVGAYFLSRQDMPQDAATDLDLYAKDIQGKRGIEGIGLFVHPDYKNSGIGRKLKDYSVTIAGADYIWGYQLKSLKNIDDWTKRRKIIGDQPGIYVTYQNLK
jgi:GNAT superfamily N-acetyltransferase